ncbi:translocation protein Sec62-domain-containing protein [Flammula alnicola]|nr:translocation protein Sec62-domain-containing protein [Flammula alnicola]
MEQQAKAPPEIKKIAQFLRGGNAGMKIRVGALNGKRLDYFKGKSAVKALLSPAFAKVKGAPKVTSEAEAQTTLQAVNAFAFFLRVQRGGPTGSSSSSPKALQIIPEQMFSPDEYYAWFYEGSQWTTIGMLGLIGLFFAIAIVRLIFYIITIVVASPGIWIFPQLFADVGFVESFIPLWEWDVPKKKSKKKKGDKKEKKSADKHQENGGAFIEEVAESEDSRPQSRSARIEEVEDEDA